VRGVKTVEMVSQPIKGGDGLNYKELGSGREKRVPGNQPGEAKGGSNMPTWEVINRKHEKNKLM